MKTRVLFLIKLLVAAALIFFVVSRIDINEVLQKLGSVNVVLFSVCVLLYFLSNLLGAAQWNVFLRFQHFKIPFRKTVSYYFTGLFFNNFLFSSVGGDVVRLVDVTRGEKKESSKVLATILVDRVFGVTCLILLGALFLIGYSAFGGALSSGVLIFYLVFGSIVVGLVLFFLSSRIRYFCFLAARKIPWRKVRLWVFHFLQALSCYRHERGVFLRALLFGLANQSSKILIAFLIGYTLKGTNLLPVLPLFFVFLPILGIVKLLPINIFGFGPHEVAGQRLFSTVGVAATVSVPYLLVFQFVVLFANLLSGLFFLFRKS